MEKPADKPQNKDDLLKHQIETAYSSLLQLRNTDLNLFWGRSSFFLTAECVLLGFFVGNFNRNPARPLLIAMCGFVIALIWIKIIHNGRDWLNRWEDQLKEIEDRVFPDLPDVTIFRYDEQKEKIKGSIKKMLIRITYCNAWMWVSFIWAVWLFRKG